MDLFTESSPYSVNDGNPDLLELIKKLYERRNKRLKITSTSKHPDALKDPNTCDQHADTQIRINTLKELEWMKLKMSHSLKSESASESEQRQSSSAGREAELWSSWPVSPRRNKPELFRTASTLSLTRKSLYPTAVKPKVRFNIVLSWTTLKDFWSDITISRMTSHYFFWRSWWEKKVRSPFKMWKLFLVVLQHFLKQSVLWTFLGGQSQKWTFVDFIFFFTFPNIVSMWINEYKLSLNI